MMREYDAMANGCWLSFDEDGTVWVSIQEYNEYEYDGSYRIDIERMSKNIDQFSEYSEIQELLAQFKYVDIDDEKSEDEILDDKKDIISDLVGEIVKEGPYVCSNCLSMNSSWSDMKEGLYTDILCRSCDSRK